MSNYNTQPYQQVTDAEYDSFVAPASVLPTFADQIRKMNTMYSAPVNEKPHLAPGLLATAALTSELPSDRIAGFMKTLSDEVAEGSEIIETLKSFEAAKYTHSITSYGSYEAEEQAVENIRNLWLRALTDLADWFSDIIVYCRSEGMKFGLPIEEVLTIIMASNYSKLGADGKPIFDSNGKFLKGPNYQKPEAYIQHLIIKLNG